MRYLDFHTHTTDSDGMLAAEAVLKQAKACGIDVLALTDHNTTQDLSALRRDNPDLTLVQGSELSCLWTDPFGRRQELHVVALGFDANHPKMQEVFRKNQPDRRPYLEAMLHSLKKCGVDLGTYEELLEEHAGSKHIGRMHIARKMVRLGYAADAEDAYDEYIGEFGRRRAYVPPMLHYVPLEEAVDAVRSAGGVAVLAHLFYYRLEEETNRALVRQFKSLAGADGGMETSYSRYCEEQRDWLRRLADENHLLHSAGSDYHAKDSTDTLDWRFPCEEFQPLLARLGVK